jgi:hypothetical protein
MTLGPPETRRNMTKISIKRRKNANKEADNIEVAKQMSKFNKKMHKRMEERDKRGKRGYAWNNVAAAEQLSKFDNKIE